MFHQRTRVMLAAAVLGGLALAARPAQADNITYSLQDLLHGQTLQVGSLTFANFSQFSSVSYGGKVMDPAHAFFSPIYGAGEAGFVLTHDGSFQLLQGQTLRTHFEFDVLTTAPDHIAGAFLGMNPPDGGGKGDLIMVQEKLSTLDRPLMISTIGNLNGIQRDFPGPVTLIHVAEDIVLDARDGDIGLGAVCQEFSQAPEPSTLTLLVLGAAGLAGTHWRRRRPGLS